MADVQTRVVSIPALGPKRPTIQIKATIAVTDTVDTIHTVAVVFDKPFVKAPVILGVSTQEAATNKAVACVDSVTATGLNANLYQIAAGDLASTDHFVYVIISGEST